MRIFVPLLICLFAVCTTSYSQGKAAAEKEARVLKGDDKGSAANNPQCKLFTSAEAGHYIGGSVTTIENAGLGYGCQWALGGGNGSMMVSVLPARYHEPPKGAPGFKKLPEIGAEGFVVPELGGWGAGAIIGPQSIRVSLSGKSASESTTVDLLKETIKRRSASGAK